MFQSHYTKIELKELLDNVLEKVNQQNFIELDPISIPHSFSDRQDREIAGLFASIFAWGQRKTTINKTKELIRRMDNNPYSFVKEHGIKDREKFGSFVHRTFNGLDAQYFLAFLQRHYQEFDTLEKAFYPDTTIPYKQEVALNKFYNHFCKSDTLPKRTLKHVASPEKKSTCKRLNMYLRWMVRRDNKGVDFGLWTTIPMSQLMIPLDVHVENFARQFRLLTRKQRDWLAVVEVTEALKQFDPSDPVKYDYSLFGLGIMKGDFNF